MKLSIEAPAAGRRLTMIACAIAFAMLAVMAIAARAQASESIYWLNYGGEPSPGIAFANIDGSGGGELNLSGTQLKQPEAMAFDPANGRFYVASSEGDQIIWANADGSGGGVLDTGIAPVEDPKGIAVDPATQTVYWSNEVTDGSIGFASANGGGGGSLNTTGATIDEPYGLALDTANGRIYWLNAHPRGEASFANLNGTGGGDLNLPEAERPLSWTGINIDPATGRLYILELLTSEEGAIYWVNLSGVGGGEVDLVNSYWGEPYGLAFDPSLGRFYWGNFGVAEERADAFGTATLAPGGGGGISIASAPVAGPQDPVVLKGPTGTGAPQVAKQGAALSCSQGNWAAPRSYPGSNVYDGGPVSYSYQWLLNGQALAGASGSTYTATAAGAYACAVTGKNVGGLASQTSSAVTVTPAALTAALETKKPHAKAGKAAVVTLRLTNGGDITSLPASVCATLTKKARKGLVTPKCASVLAVGSGGFTTVTWRVKTKKSAKGTYKFTTRVNGATVNPVTVSIKVTAAKKHTKKHHKKK